MRKKNLLLKEMCLFIHLLLSSFLFTQEKKQEVVLDESTKSYIESFKDSVKIDNPYNLIGIGYFDVYMGNNQRGNAIMGYALSKIPNPDYELYHELSVQNTKNGNYKLAFQYLDIAAKLNPEVYGYYGWVMLYYFRDYERALKYLEKYDSLTPNFSDFPEGENINHLKGMAYMNLKKYNRAIEEFDKYIQETSLKSGEDWVEVSTFYYKGLCFQFQKKYEDAIINYNKAIKYNDSFTEVYYQKGYCHIALGEKTNAKDNFQKSKELFQIGLKKQDVYIEIFHPVYIQDIEKAITLTS